MTLKELLACTSATFDGLIIPEIILGDLPFHELDKFIFSYKQQKLKEA